jgi:tripartite-type tricarboxylate transporter receptor subunit TctC
MKLMILGALAAAIPAAVLAQDPAASYPNKPVTMVLPSAPGAGVDIESRLYAKQMSEILGTQFVLDYKPGAGGTIGRGLVAKAPPDGYTLLSTSSGYTTSAALYRQLPFDATRDLRPISQLSKIGYPLLVNPSFPVKNLQEYLRYARDNPGKINFGTSGVGGLPHIMAELLHSMTKTKVTFVPYKGGSPSFQAVMAGQVNVVFGGFAAMNPHIKSGKVRMIAVSTASRAPVYPAIPSIAEQGVKEFDVAAWLGVLAPGQTPVSIINKLHGAFVKAARSEEVTRFLEREGGTIVASTPEEFSALIVREVARWKALVEEIGIEPSD